MAARSVSPAPAPIIAAASRRRAERSSQSPSRPQPYPTRQNTSADSPTRWLAGGARSRPSPAKNPVSMPVAGPCISPRATTTSRAVSGTLAPGSGSPSTNMTCSSTVRNASTAQNKARRMSASGVRRRNHYTDYLERAEVDERAHQGGTGQPARAGRDLGDDADGNAGHVRPAADGCGGDELLPRRNGVDGAEHVQPQQVGAGPAHARARHPAHLPAMGEPYSDHRRGVRCQHNGAGPRAHGGDRADESRAVEHGLVRPDAVAAAGVQGDGPLKPLADRDHVRGDDPVAARAREAQQPDQLRMLCPAELLAAQPGPESDQSALQRRDPPARSGRPGAALEETNDRPGDRTYRALRRPEHRAAYYAQRRPRGQRLASDSRIWPRVSKSSTHLPVPSTTDSRGLSAMWMGRPVSSRSRSSMPLSNAPPPVSAIPRSMTSPASSGGHLSSVVLTASMIMLSGSSMAPRTSSEDISMVFGRPQTRSRPRISTFGSAAAGNAEPTEILMYSAVRSPSMSECAFLTKVMMAWSSSSPPTRIDSEVTMPPSEITATSVVPPPISTTMLPTGSLTGSPAPIAAARGSSKM